MRNSSSIFLQYRFITSAILGLCALMMIPATSWAEAREFDLSIEDTRIVLVGKRDFHTFAFNGQVPAPLIHVKEGDDVTVNVTNMTTLTHTIHWHGMLQHGSWQNDGVPHATQNAIEPGDTFTYKFKAGPSGTMWYHCHVNVNEHVTLRGMYGPLIVEPKDPLPIEKRVTKDYIMMLSDWVSAWAHKPGEGGIPGDVFDYYTINGKSFPETQPIRVKKGDVVRLRLIGAGDLVHSIHTHGHISQIVFKDGFPLANPIMGDTVLIGPGERYDVFFEMDNPGIWMIHDHVDTHTTNGDKPDGGIMTTIEYEEVGTDHDFYVWKDKKFVPDFFYEEALKKGFGMHDSEVHRGELIED